MNFSLFLTAFAAITGLALAQVFECPADWELQEYNTYPVENDPTSFYVCGHHGAVIHTCPPNTSFNPTLYYCDWIVLPSHVVPTATVPTEEPTEEPSTEEKSTEEPEMITRDEPLHALMGRITETTPVAPIPCPQVTCPEDWETLPYHVYRDPTDCSRYCLCGHRGAILKTCPEGLLFNNHLHYCDWADSVNCNAK